MKKIVLSLAVLASVALVSCNKGAEKADSETAAVAETGVVEESTAVESAATELPAESAAAVPESAKA